MSEMIAPRETIVYGGAFNPPTLAHQAILQACVDYAQPRDADVWLLPSASRPDKHIRQSNVTRIALCEALARDVVHHGVIVRVDTTELVRGIQTETYDTVKEFDMAHPRRSFRWVFGSDSVATMSSWQGGKWMLAHIPMLIVQRPGSPVSILPYVSQWLEVESSDMSSTQLRERMACSMEFDELVGPEVAKVLNATTKTLVPTSSQVLE